LHFEAMDRGVKQLALPALLLALLVGFAVYFATASDGGKADRNVPGATTGPGKATLAD
jgi:hypothetical protein